MLRVASYTWGNRSGRNMGHRRSGAQQEPKGGGGMYDGCITCCLKGSCMGSCLGGGGL